MQKRSRATDSDSARAGSGLSWTRDGDDMKRAWRRLTAAALAAGLLWFAWFENCTIVTEQLEVTLPSMPAALSGLRIAVVADLHGVRLGRENARLLRALASARPDLIAVCGDLIDDAAQLAWATALLGECVKIAPVYYVTGNHEWACGAARSLMAALEREGVCVLGNDYRVLSAGGRTLVIAGAHDPNGPYDMERPEALVARIRAQCGDAPIVMLSHRNDALDGWASLGVELVLCGHGHGGVIRLPGVGGLLGTDRSLLPEYTAGLYRAGATQMAVSRGLGNVGGIPRLCNRPELLIVTLQAEKA